MTRSRPCPHCLGTGFVITIDDVLAAIPPQDRPPLRPQPRPGTCGAPWWDLTVDPPVPRVRAAPTAGGLCGDHRRQLDWIATRIATRRPA